MARSFLWAACLCLFAASPALAQVADVTPVPPPTSGAADLAAPAPQQPAPVVVQPAPQVVQGQATPPGTGYVQPAAGYAQPGAAYGQPYAGQPVVGQPVVGQPIPGSFEPPPRRGDRLEDRAGVGEVVDLMIVTGGFGAVFANAIIDWAPDEVSGPPSHTTATVFGLALSLTGLLTLEAPRGVPTLMAIGLRYGALLGGFGYGAFVGNSFDFEGFLVGVTLGGVVGYGIGAGVGFGARPHVSRSRFVESGGLWGAGFAALLGGAICASGTGTCSGSAGPMAALFAGITGGLLTHTLIASLTPVSAGRGWLMNAGFAAGAGLGALVTWGFSNGHADDEYILGVAAAVGFVGLGTIFAVTDSLQDPGWDESTEQALSRVSIGVAPTEGGFAATASGQF